MELIPPNHMKAKSVRLVAGTSSSSVFDLQILNYGNVYEVAEVAEVPGLDMRITFINVLRFSKIGFAAYYDGRPNHYVQLQMFNFVRHTWETYFTLKLSSGMSYQYFDTPCVKHHIKSGEVWMRFTHPLRGTVPGKIFIDYVALVR